MTDRNQDLDTALSETVAVILAGGRGTRLHDLGTYQAKPAIPFGGSYKLIDFPLSNCINSGIRRIGIATQFQAQSLMRHITRGWSFLHRELNEFIDLWPAEQTSDGEGWYKGTADAVYRNLSHVAGQAPKHILVLAGDHVYKQDYRRMLADHIALDADVTVSCVEVPTEQAHSFGIVTTHPSGAITAFVEKPKSLPAVNGANGTCLASMGIYLFKTAFLAELLYDDHHNAASGHDFGHDLLPRLIDTTKIHAHRFSESCQGHTTSVGPYWRDVGTLDAYWRANMDLTKPQPPLDMFDTSWPIRTALEQLPSAKVTQSVHNRDRLVRNVVLAPGTYVNDSYVVDSVLSCGVRAAPRCRIEESLVLPNATIGKGAHLRQAIVAEGCEVPDGFTVGHDAVEDARWFTRTPKGVTLVTPQGLLQRAIGQKLSRMQGVYPGSTASRGLQPRGILPPPGSDHFSQKNPQEEKVKTQS